MLLLNACSLYESLCASTDSIISGKIIYPILCFNFKYVEGVFSPVFLLFSVGAEIDSK